MRKFINKTMAMKKVFGLAVGVLFFSYGNAQVGIGNNSPNSGSILDLTNSNDKSLLLPTATATPSGIPTFNTQGMVMYFGDKISVKTSTGTNVLSPWLYDGTPSNGTYIPSGTPVAIGLTSTPSSPVILQIAASTDASVTGSNASIAIGTLSSTHLLFDNDEILAKSNATTGGTLKLQDDGGTVTIRSGATATSATVLTANGSIDAAGSGKILQNGLDLIPAGTIVIWNGSVNASGYPLMGVTPNTNWHICDGTLGTPDLRERFIVGAGGDNPTVAGTSGYANGATGGENTHALSIAELPAHSHTGSTNSAGSHTHTLGSVPSGGEGYVGAYNGSNEVFDYDETTTLTSSTDGSHSHTLTINNTGSGTAHENRPPYYALIYIMKL